MNLGHVLSIVLFVALVIQVRGQSPPPKQCKGVDLKMSEDKVMTVKECLKEAGADCFKDVAPEKLPCVFTCILKKRQIIDDSGVLKKENFQQLVNDDLPDEFKQDLNTRIGACFDEHGSKANAENPTCSSPDLVGCIRTAYATVCKD